MSHICTVGTGEWKRNWKQNVYIFGLHTWTAGESPSTRTFGHYDKKKKTWWFPVSWVTWGEAQRFTECSFQKVTSTHLQLKFSCLTVINISGYSENLFLCRTRNCTILLFPSFHPTTVKTKREYTVYTSFGLLYLLVAHLRLFVKAGGSFTSWVGGHTHLCTTTYPLFQ